VIEVELTTAIKVRAEEMFKKAQSSNALRFRKEKADGNTTWTGVLGQAVFEAVLSERKMPFIPVDLTTHDYVVCGLKVDVKTKGWSRPAGDDVEVSVFDYIRDHQAVDYYAFVHLQLAPGEDRNGPPSPTRFQRAWLLGVMDKSQYLYLATEVKEGTVFESGHIAKASSLNLVAAKLLPVEEFGGAENE
jgi:hypothetical protein